MDKKTYTINDKTWYQAKLVPGQIQQLCKALTGIKDFRIMDLADAGDLVTSLGSNILRLLAIILNPEGVKIKDKDLEKLEDELFEADIDIMEVVADFFTLNPTDTLFNKLTGMISKTTDMIVANTVAEMKKIMDEAMTGKTADGSKSSSSTSPEETSPGANT